MAPTTVSSAQLSEVELRLLSSSNLQSTGATTRENQVKSGVFRTWPGPKTLRESTTKWNLCLLDVLLFLSALAYFVFAILCAKSNGQALSHKESNEQPRGDILLKISPLATTIFPYVFAATLARFLKNLAKWRTEKGLTLGTLAQMLGSTTIANTLLLPWKLRSMTPLMLGLFLGWALSPLGSQAAFRAISRQSRVIDTPMSIDLLDTNSPWPRSLTIGDTDQWDTVKLVYSASIAANSATRNASVDPWSNILVPAIETFENTSIPDAEGWFRDLDLNMAQHASLLGIPFTGKGLERAEFTFQTSYFQLTTVNFTFIRDKPWDLSPQYIADATKKTAGYLNSTGQKGQVVLATWCEPSWRDTSFDEHWQPGVPQRLLYQDKSLGFIRAEFDVTMNYVELQVSRNSSSASRPWQLTAIRRLKNMTGVDTSWSPLKNMMTYTFFTSNFLDVFPLKRAFAPTNLQKYLVDPTGLLSSPGDIPEDKIKNITPENLAIRMGQLLNSYWLASLAPRSILANFNASVDGDFNVQASSNGTSHTDEEFLQCHTPWLQILFTCSFLLMVTAIGSGLCECLSNVPDVLDTISSLTRKNKIVVDEGGSYLDGDDRTRILKNVVVRMGDAAPDAETGLVVLANVGKLGKLDRNKQYA